MHLLQCKDTVIRRDRRSRAQQNGDRNEQEPQRNFSQRSAEQRGQYHGNYREHEKRNKPSMGQPNNSGRKFGGSSTTKNMIDVHALDRELQQNPTAACGLTSENGV